MCVIIHKPAGVQMPQLHILESCFLRNRDGIGFCTSSGKSWHGMSFYKFLSELGKTDDSEEIIIHFRWATHGSVSRKNCHPFYDKEHDIWFAHNGFYRYVRQKTALTVRRSFETGLFLSLMRMNMTTLNYGTGLM